MNIQFSRKLLRAVPVGIAFAGAALTGATAQAEETARASNQVIEEITVTARKREERVVDTPVAVAVLSAEEIERYNTRDLAQLTQRIPGVAISHGAGGGAGGNMVIRGVGNLAGDYGADQPVSLVLDGMSFSRGHVLDTGFFDLQAIEVLKGPQALFFGKNSPAGVIAVTSVTPEVGGEVDAFIRAQYEFVSEDPVLEAGVSFPVGEHWAFRLAARRQDMQDGWLDNSAQPLDVSALYPGFDISSRGASDNDRFPNQKQTVARFTAVWEPTDTFDATLKLFHSKSKQNEAGYTILYDCADGPGSNPYYVVFPDPTQTCPDAKARLERNSALPPAEVINAHPFLDEDDRFFNKLNQEVFTLQMNWELNDVLTLSSVTGYWDYRHREYTNYDYTSYAVVVSKQGESGDSWSQELRLQSNFDGPVNFMLGAFYEDMSRDLDAPVQILPSAFTGGVQPYVAGQRPGDEFYDGTFINYHQHWDNDIESFSAFGSVDWEINEMWDISGGLRYTTEDRASIGGNIFENGLSFSPPGVFYTPKDKSDNVSPEVTVSYHINDDVLTYLAFKTGFQSAGISNPGTVADFTSFTPEEQNDILVFDETTIKGFEIGLKGYFMEGRLRGDIAAYFYESEDLQVAIFNSNTTTFTLQNAAVAHNTGFEAQGIFQVNEKLQLRLAGQYNVLKFDEWEDAGCNSIDGAVAVKPTVGPGCHTEVDPISGTTKTIQDMSGEKYGGPPLQINAGFSYDTPIISNWNLDLSVDVIHHNKGKKGLKQEGTATPSRTVANVAATLYQQDGNWEVGLICANCFNEIYVTGIGNKPLAKINPGVNGDLTGSIAPPRLVTLQLTYRM
jgi:iron complex outermembrane receptor protein